MKSAVTAGAATSSAPTKLERHAPGKTGRWRIVWLLALTLPPIMVAGVAIGSVAIPPGTVAGVIVHHLQGASGPVSWTGATDSIVWDVRLPRVLLAALVGTGLAISGTVLQAMVRNLLAEPYLLGISSGASTGAAAAILFGAGGALGANSLSVSAFVGAMVASLAVLIVARSGGRVTSVRLLLAGVAVGYALYAATSFLIFASDSPEGTRSVLFWLLGSLAQARWANLGPAAAVIVASAALLTLWARRLDALAIGDDTCHSLGIQPDRLRLRLLAVVSLCVGTTVAVSGGIGFVGLVVPHLARRMVGATHRLLVPASGLLGAGFLVIADTFARTTFSPQELPIGIVTAAVGAPFLLLLIHRLHSAT